MTLRAVNVLRENVRALMAQRQLNQKAVAFALSRHPTWINKFLLGHRMISVTDLDKLADLLGVATYQLFQPGVSKMTERRRGDRRLGPERRVSHETRLARDLEERMRPLPKESPHVTAAALRRVLDEFDRGVRALFSETDPRGQTPAPRRDQSGRRPRRRAAGGSLPPET